MRFLFCLAFWLSVVLYYLPSFEPKRAPSEPRKTANISRSTNTPTADAGPTVLCSEPAQLRPAGQSRLE